MQNLQRAGASTLAIVLFPLVLAAPAQAGDLAAYLERAERMTAANEKVEADVTVKEVDGSTRTLRVVIDPGPGGSVGAGGTVVVEDTAAGWKAELPLDWKDGKITASGGAPAPHAPDAPLPGTDLRAIDFFPFWKTDYGRAFVSDENTLEQTVSLYADEGRPYTLYVITFDKAKLVPRMVKYYRDSFNNLVRIRTDKNWVMVGSRPRPTEVLVKDFQTNSLRSYTLAWKLAGDAEAAPAPAQ